MELDAKGVTPSPSHRIQPFLWDMPADQADRLYQPLYSIAVLLLLTCLTPRS